MNSSQNIQRLSHTKFTSCSSDFVLKTLERASDLKMLISFLKNQNFTEKYTDRKTINSNNCAKFEVNWPRGSQFTARHTKNRLQFDE
jgi:hypothetical protein